MNRALQTLLLILLTMICGGIAAGQRATGVITGRVVSDDGRPIPHASINIIGSGRRMLSGRMSIVTDDEGNFQADGLDPAPYLVTATAPGYVMTADNRAVDLFDPGQPDYVYLGESVTITMMKGSVITGKVTSDSGDPVIGVQVRAMRVRDANGRPVTAASGFGASMIGSRTTDDRGVYRLYGLAPGAYVISAGGSGFSVRMTPYDARMPIYHPSSTRDAASEITVRSGEEVSGIDIRYRAERGSAISGKVTGAPAGGTSGVALSVTSINLRQASSGVVIASTFIPPVGDQNGYAFYGVANGEYELVATRGGANDETSLASPPRRVVISGRDATGVDLVLAPLASLSGIIVIEKPQPDAQKCESRREFQIDEVMLKAAREAPAEKTEMQWGLPQNTGAPDEKGAFQIRGLRPGRYRIESPLPDDLWYLRTITMPGANGAAATDIGRSGLLLRGGEKLSGVNVTIASGGAQLKGRVTAAEGAKLPARLRVFLVPAEKEAAENVLRYAEAKADSDGAFSLSHLAPGRYLLLARAVDDESDEKPVRPQAWDNAGRAKLRKDAEAANVTVELKACQRVNDFKLKYAAR
ncbi:MAG: carboxypeptidase regulatory-like domain-containing protein [Blastocatellia bacterium]